MAGGGEEAGSRTVWSQGQVFGLEGRQLLGPFCPLLLVTLPIKQANHSSPFPTHPCSFPSPAGAESPWR